MSDLVERLRATADSQTICGVDIGRSGSCHAGYLIDEAADEIERLQELQKRDIAAARIKRLEVEIERLQKRVEELEAGLAAITMACEALAGEQDDG